jgi:uncharacterized protein
VTRFIDFHVHPPVPEFLEGAFAPFLPGMEREFGRTFETVSVDELAEHYRSRDGRAVLLAWDAESATRRRPLTNARVAAMVDQHPDVLIGFGSVDPHKGAAAVAGVYEAARLGLRGIKLHPPAQRFSPSDRLAYPVWDAASATGLPVLVHTGYTAMGAGELGGRGVELRYGDPMLMDRVAADFPDLRIVLAHPSWPWQDQALAVARHKANVYLELSGWSPALLTEPLIQAIRGPLAERTLFGTDFPFITPDKWLGDFEKLDMPEDVARRILHDNAAELLGI